MRHNSIILAPRYDSQCLKIVPCSNHKREFSISTFFSIHSPQQIPVTELTNAKYDSFRFDISNYKERQIHFQVKPEYLMLGDSYHLDILQLLDHLSTPTIQR